MTTLSSRTRTLLALIAVIGGLAAAFYCTLPGEQSTAPGPDTAEVVTALQTLADQNLLELSLQIAYFHAREGRLPRSLEEVRDKVRVPDWPPAPMATSHVQAIDYRTTSARTYTFTLPGNDGKLGTADDVVIPQDVPADPPPDLNPDTFRRWWVAKQLAQMPQL